MIVDIRSEEAKHTLGALNFAYSFKRKNGEKDFRTCLKDSYIDIDVANGMYSSVRKSYKQEDGFSSVTLLTHMLKEKSDKIIEKMRGENAKLKENNKLQSKYIDEIESENEEYAATNERFAKNEKANNETYTNVCNQLTAEKNSLGERVNNLKNDLREQCNLTDRYLTELNQLKGALALLIK